MEKPNFLNPNIKLGDIEQLKDEPSYFQDIKELADKGKFIKKSKNFLPHKKPKNILQIGHKKKIISSNFYQTQIILLGHLKIMDAQYMG